MDKVPEHFAPLNSVSPFNNLVGPYYAALLNESLIIGMVLEEKHCNTSGRLHGAMVCAIFDTVLGHNVGLTIAKEAGEDLSKYAAGVQGASVVTVSLTTEYMGTANKGDWIESTAQVQRAGRSLAYVNAELYCAEERIAKASGVFRIFS